jgi:hypothetical protein
MLIELNSFHEKRIAMFAPMHTNQFKCDICDKTFARKESMQKHECRVLAKIIIEEEEHEQNEEAKKVVLLALDSILSHGASRNLSAKSISRNLHT